MVISGGCQMSACFELFTIYLWEKKKVFPGWAIWAPTGIPGQKGP